MFNKTKGPITIEEIVNLLGEGLSKWGNRKIKRFLRKEGIVDKKIRPTKRVNYEGS
jgi:hypothetical protein